MAMNVYDPFWIDIKSETLNLGWSASPDSLQNPNITRCRNNNFFFIPMSRSHRDGTVVD